MLNDRNFTRRANYYLEWLGGADGIESVKYADITLPCSWLISKKFKGHEFINLCGRRYV